jgi:signal transduction histidine kinase
VEGSDRTSRRLGQHRKMKRSRSVRAYVVRLVIAVAVPLLAFGAFLLIRSADNEGRAIATTVQERAQGVAADLDRELRNLHDLVSILAASHSVVASDLAALSRRYALWPLLDRGLGLVVRDLSGELLNTCTGDGRPFPAIRAVGEVAYTASTYKPHITDLITDPISGEPLLTIDLPVWRGDESVLIVSLCALPRILQILIEQHLPDGWSAVIVDSQGRVIASIRESSGGSFAAAGADSATVAEADIDWIAGQWGRSGTGYEASSPVYLAGWTVTVTVPGKIFSGPVRRALLVLFVAGGGTLALVLVLAFAIGRRISGPLTRVAGVARTLGRGSQIVPPPTGINEADLIAHVLCSTDADLKRRTAELTQTVEALRQGEKRLLKLSDDLRQALDERKELLNRILSAQERERQRIARELHDHLGQYFTAMLLGLKAAEKASGCHGEGYLRIADLKDMTSAMSREVYQLAWELRPTALDDLGLEAAIANYLEKWSGRFDLNVDFVSNLREKRLSAPVEITLYRVLQEAMTNVAKHAHAERVSVALDADGAEVRLVVEDDGTGFAARSANVPSAPTGGFGLLGIRERLALVGGSLIIEPVSDHGTALFCRIPA